MSGFIADAIFWIAVASCTVAQVAIVRSILISPTRPAPAAGSTEGEGVSSRRPLELFWAVLPGIALAAVFIFTWRAIHGAGVA